MESPNDFNPIAGQGELETAGGLLGRWSRRQQLPAVGVGFRLVLIDDKGQPRAGGEQLTAGEKYWAPARSWVKVDVTDHTLLYTIPFPDLSGRAGFIATVKLSSSVGDANEVAARAIASVRGYLEPTLQETVVSVAGEVAHSAESDPIVALTDARHNAEVHLRQAMVGNMVKGLPAWLVARVESIVVALDEATERHHKDLVRRSRDGELIDADAENERRQAQHQIALREQWRSALGPHMADPVARAVEVMISDPSKQNIEHVVEQLDSAEVGLQEKMLGVLESLIGSEYLYKTSDLPAAVDLVRSALKRQTFSLAGPPAEKQVEELQGEAKQLPEEGGGPQADGGEDSEWGER